MAHETMLPHISVRDFCRHGGCGCLRVTALRAVSAQWAPVCAAVCEMLAMNGIASTVAYSGEAALRAVEHEAPDAVLLDIGLPDIDGYEVCQRVRRSGITRQPMLIALTGWGQDKDRELATTAGFDAHLTKPADIDQVLAMLQEAAQAQ